MNLRKIIFLLFFVIAAVFMSDCKKRLFDYRNKYLGKWDINVIDYNWSLGNSSTTDTLHYTGSVSYKRSDEKNVIRLDGEKKFYFEVDNSGNLSMCDVACGQISTHEFSAKVNYNNCTFALGSGESCTITATKK